MFVNGKNIDQQFPNHSVHRFHVGLVFYDNKIVVNNTV